MSVSATFLQCRHLVPIWLWPVLLYELCIVKAWAEAEANWRGQPVEFLYAVDCFGRVYVQAVSDLPEPPGGATGNAPFEVPARLQLLDQDVHLDWTCIRVEPAYESAPAADTPILDSS